MSSKVAEDIKNLGNELLRKGDYDGAFEMYTKAIKLEPNNPIFYFNRSTANLLLYKYEDCLKDSKMTIQLDQLYIKAYHRKSVSLEYLCEHVLSMKCILEGIKKWQEANDISLPEDYLNGINSVEIEEKTKSDKGFQLLLKQLRHLLEPEKNKLEKLLKSKKNIVLYVGDAMCSWCYGLAPEMEKLRKKYESEEIEFHIISGGLRPYCKFKMSDYIPPFGSTLGKYIEHHWIEVNQKCGRKFNHNILKSDFVYDTEPPARALCVFQEMKRYEPITSKRTEAIDYYDRLQVEFYSNNKDMNRIETYSDICEDFDLSIEKFKCLFESNEMKEHVRQDFSISKKLGISGYPTILVKTKESKEFVTVVGGYCSFEELDMRFSRFKF